MLELAFELLDLPLCFLEVFLCLRSPERAAQNPSGYRRDSAGWVKT
jgi:hypothetical protein